ncbi:hypothetical protein FQP90_07310 [Paenarthrobacter nitroguajacolicus]|uniref:Uncharacterized protein n=1 Tax=Paenarthrobacter nitroguajacolicus TaxID=211146 RepID=A0A558H6Z7_PAENT|nr:hypothetical protein [Paenarthrobacter nitroguajacolicus]TVU64851.1 hypothetical protein FQP90_07310 [Paenarthrobacter nitroguajacolicus]
MRLFLWRLMYFQPRINNRDSDQATKRIDTMRMPAPNDLAQAPLWEIYIIAQTVAAMRGQIPKHALAVGVEIHGVKIKLRFQLSRVTDEDKTDMEDILSELEAYVGQDVEVDSVSKFERNVEFYRMEQTMCTQFSSPGLTRHHMSNPQSRLRKLRRNCAAAAHRQNSPSAPLADRLAGTKIGRRLHRRIAMWTT